MSIPLESQCANKAKMQNHNMLPSPGRLGGPGIPQQPATSSALQRPSSSSSSSPSQSQVEVAHRVRPLEKLPPYERAHALLNELAGLTTRLFEVSNNKAAWQMSYRSNLPKFLPEANIPKEALEAKTTREVLNIAETRQNMLIDAVAEILDLQKIEKEKEEIVKEVASKDIAMRKFAKKLREAQLVLEDTFDKFSEYKPRKRAKASSSVPKDGVAAAELSLSDILSYAHKISYTTFAPPDFGADQAPLRGAMAPAPQEEQMRASMLYQFADLDVGIPKTTTAETMPVAIIEPPPPLPPQATAVEAPPIPMLPPGWRPGMPVDLSAMPAMPALPPGWKPGDPVPMPSIPPVGLKPETAATMPPRAEEPSLQQPIPVAPPRGPQNQPIQVKFVNLDIDQEVEDSSEYSSEGSSEVEDDDAD